MVSGSLWDSKWKRFRYYDILAPNKSRLGTINSVMSNRRLLHSGYSEQSWHGYLILESWTEQHSWQKSDLITWLLRSVWALTRSSNTRYMKTLYFFSSNCISSVTKECGYLDWRQNSANRLQRFNKVCIKCEIVWTIADFFRGLETKGGNCKRNFSHPFAQQKDVATLHVNISPAIVDRWCHKTKLMFRWR